MGLEGKEPVRHCPGLMKELAIGVSVNRKRCTQVPEAAWRNIAKGRAIFAAK